MQLSKNKSLYMDLYQLTMAMSYFKTGIAYKQAFFNMHFRKMPFNGGFAVSAGLEILIDHVLNFKFSQQDIEYLSQIKAINGDLLFSDDFLRVLADFKFCGTIRAIKEGEIVFNQSPLITVEGGLMECQLLESIILNIINHSSLIATKAARMFVASGGKDLIEFGLRRSQGLDSSILTSRASYIGGFSATSNVAAAQHFDIPIRGTHSHSWVLSFDDELSAFKAYADVLGHNLIFLVDTYDTISGIKNAIKVAKTIDDPAKFLGIRIDSGDLAYLSKQARLMLDAAGFKHAKILVSNDLDEYLIESLKFQDAKVDIWAVGTKLVTAYDNPSLGGVYKLSALKDNNGVWKGKLKISNDPLKINNPGRLQLKRFFDQQGSMIADALYDIDLPYPQQWQIINFSNAYLQKTITDYQTSEDMLVNIIKDGKLVYNFPDINNVRKKLIENLKTLDTSIKRLFNAHIYPIGLEFSTYHNKYQIVKSM